jgi:Fur family ferric uptake transcriptional regulator
MKDGITDILKKSGLSLTDTRKRILQLFLESDNALAHADIERLSGDQFDRVTVYRTLQTFVDKGIIHTIPTADNAVRYALCQNECTAGHHLDEHVHFVCDICGVTFCLQHTVIPQVQLPNGFKLRQVDVLASGKCNKCA